jgi:WD40 repeat protein
MQSPDGKSVAVGTEVGHVVVIDVETRAIVATYPSHAMPVRSVSWSPDSQVRPIRCIDSQAHRTAFVLWF